MLKYKSKDTEKMIDVFAALAEKDGNPIEIGNEIVKLLDYPVPVLHELLKCMEIFKKYDINRLKEDYLGVIGYITLRINLVKE